MQLYSYFRSSAAYRVRIALNLKGLPYEYAPVHLLKDGGQQLKPEYTRLNPQALLPTLVDGDAVLTQSMAIIEYLEETHPQPPLLPATPIARARVRALAQGIACDIHPLNNLRVLRYLKREFDLPDEARDRWYRHWVESGLLALERMLADSPDTGTYCHGDTPTMADACLVPQVFNARRLDCDLSAMPNIVRIDAACLALPAFAQAAPDAQPDAG
ncbi:maleylacetoacetate isomerase [Bordetella sputigena]|uniref:maleylacetoacetate isomerase n=1 Tax=Bordetella sputigena TaxID=1416810 RepID=UPI0039EE4ECE